jgi:hypothetical protein
MVKGEAREHPLRFSGVPAIRRGSGGPQKLFSWLSEGVEAVFTINTEVGEETSDLYLHQLFTPHQLF